MQRTEITEEYSFRTGAVRWKTLGYILAGRKELDDKEVPHTVILEWDAEEEGLGGHDLNWTASTACVCDHPKEQMVIVGRFGEFLVAGQGEAFEGEIAGRPTPSGDPAPFRRASSIHGKAYAVGMNSQVFRRDDRREWTAIHEGLAPGLRLEDIDGYGSEELYTVGWKGALWRYDGRKWSEIQSGTNVILHSVHCAPDGHVYACGQAGTILVGRGDEFTSIEQEEVGSDLWDVQSYRGQLYYTTLNFLYELSDGTELRPVGFGVDHAVSTYRLSVRDDVLWSVGHQDVMMLTGDRWERII